jgi:hypothetical protein
MSNTTPNHPTPEPTPAPGGGAAPPYKTNGAAPISDEPEPTPAVNIFDNLDSLRLDPATAMSSTVEYLAHVPVRKPGKIEFVRAHPDPAMSLASAIFDDEDERESYFIAPSAWSLLAGYLKPVLLVTTISRQGTVFLWPVPLPSDEAGGRGIRAWGESQRAAADKARSTWIRMKADMSLGAYRINAAEGELSDPIWPARSFSELLTIAFKGRIVSDANHPILRKLRGLS